VTSRDVVDIADFRKGYDLNRFTPERRRYLLRFVLKLFINTQLDMTKRRVPKLYEDDLIQLEG
jgi:hypothetical protein